MYRKHNLCSTAKYIIVHYYCDALILHNECTRVTVCVTGTEFVSPHSQESEAYGAVAAHSYQSLANSEAIGFAHWIESNHIALKPMKTLRRFFWMGRCKRGCCVFTSFLYRAI